MKIKIKKVKSTAKKAVLPKKLKLKQKSKYRYQ